MSVRARLVAAILAATVITAIPALFALQRLQDARDVAVELREHHAAAGSAVGDLRSALRDVDLAVRGYVGTGSRGSRRRLARAVTDMAAASARLEATAYGEPSREILTTTRAIRGGVYEVSSLVEAGAVDPAIRAVGALDVLLERVDADLASLDGEVRERSAAAAARAEGMVSSARTTTAVALAVAVVLAFVVGGALASGVVRPLHRLRDAMVRVADGRLEPPEWLEYDRDDELGSLNRVFRWMTSELAELDRLKAEFVSAASHKLKTPVSVVMGYAEMLRGGEFGETRAEQDEVLREVEEQLEQLAAQIDQLMRLSRAEAGSLRLDFGETSPEDLVVSLRDAFRASARQKEIEYTVVVEPDTPARFRVDEERLRDMVLGNLLSNAFRYCGRGDRVELRVQPGTNGNGAAAGSASGEPASSNGEAGGTEVPIRFQVSDTGPGIPEEHLERIFEPHYRAAEDGSEIGSGMGLAIAHQVVRAHGGQICARNRKEGGCVFIVQVPGGRMDTG